MARQPKTEEKESYFDRVSSEIDSKQSRLTMILGGLIILVVVVLLFNYFNRSKPSIGPSQQTQQGDVSPENLPGTYTVKEGDTLFSIAEKYYQDGYKYTEIAAANNLANPDNLETGQQLNIPKLSDQDLEVGLGQPSESPSETPISTPTEEIIPALESNTQAPQTSKGGQDWGPTISGDTYEVVVGDWLSTIAARAYNGDIMAYTKLAEANNIPNPDLIYPGMVLEIPR
ncbi:hypothetical protein A3B45_02985 [Candidatus Daviesbacteria bacterium RIFCSPLOWO2_01_FULL_39_12]|uniref:LysM domain-containing protein n=1 Tax=Candidatus Daviesbacteria bacterium RIFCSPLOWO2_01_FULL_39_12 TaxID=1797785 RepID=A0A1F5KT31_9BACT|nr:MAG: hypothetical protein A3D79_01700 [Candidatus Daviesbacteria bacterium RIFCSPHIGHO2_02_FULL_39_8]OGE43989.1 MAG: hypothetical protein A3B45_02985 [Candidatus Daviesbacteria bacterium RIFCSPLOWO2_01_FULL_39_12]